MTWTAVGKLCWKSVHCFVLYEKKCCQFFFMFLTSGVFWVCFVFGGGEGAGSQPSSVKMSALECLGFGKSMLTFDILNESVRILFHHEPDLTCDLVVFQTDKGFWAWRTVHYIMITSKSNHRKTNNKTYITHIHSTHTHTRQPSSWGDRAV